MEPTASKANWPAFILIAIFAIVLVVGLVFFIFKSSEKPATTTNKKANQVSNNGEVVITKAGFVPQSIIINKGSSIKWTNKDTAPHEVISGPYPQNNLLPNLDSYSLSPNDSYSYTFEKTGKFTYLDKNNPLSLTGEVEVK